MITIDGVFMFSEEFPGPVVGALAAGVPQLLQCSPPKMFRPHFGQTVIR